VEHKIKIIEGDVAEVLPKMKEKFDRIVMPAPKDAPDFLELALEKVKNNGMVHLYTFASEEEIESKEIVRKVEQRCKEHGTNAKVVFFRKCGAVGPYHYRVVLDIQVK
jgi:tRNA G37 N-methylase Trm5